MAAAYGFAGHLRAQAFGMIALAWHDVDSPDCPNEKRGSEAYHYVLDREVFAAQLDLIVRSGHEVLTAAELEDRFIAGREIPKRALLLTFDDGHKSFFHVIRPMLKARDLRGDCFQITDDIDTPAGQSGDELKIMHAEGFGIGAHGVTHRPLRGLPPEELAHEAQQSRRMLVEILGEAASFAYPHGARDAASDRALERAGYRLIFTSEPGVIKSARQRLALPRIAITRATSLDDFARIVNGDGRLLARLIARRKALLSARRVLGEGLYRRIRGGLISKG